jgi:hypothetical protein
VLVLSSPALADDDPPFQMEPSSWMSFDRYKEKPANWIAPDERAEAALQPVIVPPPLTPADMPVITPPTRPVETAPLPGLNKDFDVRVNTTEDDNWKPATALADPDAKPDIDLQDNWQDAAAAARLNKDKKQTLESSNGHTVYDVRLSYLPARITPLPKAAKKAELAQAKISLPAATIAAAAPPPPAPKVSAADAAACAALDAYKKRQLAAIESDRKTLSALQSAIAQLGLNKQLDFMAGASGSLGKQAITTPDADTQNPASAHN